MNRREAISAVATLLGGTIVGSNMFLTGCKNTDKKVAVISFDKDQIALLDEIAEIIIPTTNTPGAKAAGVGEFMTVMVKDCYEDQSQRIFMEGMEKLQSLSNKKYDHSFTEIDAKQRHDLLAELDKEQNQYTKSKKDDQPAHYFRMMKELTLVGYFTSEVGATQALRYVESPGSYVSCVPYKKGEKAWA